jgi:hypothetical protein
VVRLLGIGPPRVKEMGRWTVLTGFLLLAEIGEQRSKA